MAANLGTGTVLGLLVAGIAWALSGKHHLHDRRL
jgi:hypothetical protein